MSALPRPAPIRDLDAKGLESLWSGLALFRITAGRRADVFCKMIAKKVVKQL